MKRQQCQVLQGIEFKMNKQEQETAIHETREHLGSDNGKREGLLATMFRYKFVAT